MINVIDKKQIYDNVIPGKDIVFISMFLTSSNLMSILCLVMHILCVYDLL